MEQVLVLGGSGFLGSHVTSELRDAGYDPVVASRRTGMDLCDFESTRSHLAELRPDVIVNCAAHVGSVHYVTEFSATVLQDNMQMALNLYRAAHESCPEVHVINPLSNCSYPGDANIHYEPDWWNGAVHDSVLPYGTTRKMVYVVSQCYAQQHGMHTTNFLVANAYGPGDYVDPNKVHALNGMIIRFLRAKWDKQGAFEIWGTGKPIREWVYVRDVARMLVDAISTDRGEAYPLNIAQNRGYSIAELARTIADAVGFAGELTFNTQYQDGAPIKVLDDRHFRAAYPDFEFYPIEQGIRDTVAYYEEALDRPS